MADTATFRQALQRCGIEQDTARNVIVEQGYSDMTEFAQMSEADIQTFVKEVNKMPPVTVGNAEVKPSIPFASIKKLRAMRKWTIERGLMGLPVAHPSFTAAEMTRIMTRMDFEAQLEVNKPKPPPLPDKFVNFSGKWRPFYEGFKGHLAVARGCMNVPLLYVVREHTEVTETIRNATYSSSDERLMNVVVLTTDEYKEDNRRVWDLLRPLVYGTSAWNYVKQYDRSENGRMAFRVLQRRGEGDAALDARRTKAEDIMTNTKYTGRSKRFTLQHYTNTLQGAFTEMEECGEPVSERRKVDTYVKGMQADRLKVMKLSIMSNPTTRNDFMEAYTFVETMEQYDSSLTSGTDGFDRTISSVEQTNGSVDTSRRSWDEWSKLSPEEKRRILDARESKKRRGSGGGKGKGGSGGKALNKLKRKLSKLATDAIKEFDAAGGTESSGDGNSQGGDSGSNKKVKFSDEAKPSDQFGRRAHAMYSFAEAVSKLGATGEGGSQQ